MRIYDESNNDVSQSNLKNSDTIISILEIQGIKFTARNFQIIVEMKQSMIVSPDPFLDECFIYLITLVFILIIFETIITFL